MQTIFLPVIGLVDSDKLKPADLVGVNKDSYLILDTLPAEYEINNTCNNNNKNKTQHKQSHSLF